MTDGQLKLMPDDPKGTNQWGRISSLPPAHRATDPDTSKRAARKPRDGQRARILEALEQGPVMGMTDYELAQATGLEKGSASKRRSELRHLGFVEATELRRRTNTGSSAIVWKLKQI